MLTLGISCLAYDQGSLFISRRTDQQSEVTRVRYPHTDPFLGEPPVARHHQALPPVRRRRRRVCQAGGDQQALRGARGLRTQRCSRRGTVELGLRAGQ